jgi:hypothetical protein
MKIRKAATSAPRMAVAMAMPATVPPGRILPEDGVWPGRIVVVVIKVVTEVAKCLIVVVAVVVEVMTGVEELIGLVEEDVAFGGAMILCRPKAPNGLTEAFEVTYRSCDGILRQHIKSFWKC